MLASKMCKYAGVMVSQTMILDPSAKKKARNPDNNLYNRGSQHCHNIALFFYRLITLYYPLHATRSSNIGNKAVSTNKLRKASKTHFDR